MGNFQDLGIYEPQEYDPLKTLQEYKSEFEMEPVTRISVSTDDSGWIDFPGYEDYSWGLRIGEENQVILITGGKPIITSVKTHGQLVDLILLLKGAKQ